MRKFFCYFKQPDNAEETGFCNLHQRDYEGTVNIAHKLFQAAKRLVNLTHLTLRSTLNVHGFAVDDVSSFMDNFRSLVFLELIFEARIDLAFDQKVDQLVRRNPGLRKLVFFGLNLSDATLTSVARLHHLLELRLHGPRVRLTTNGVLTLLRSRLRTLLRVARFEVRGPTGTERQEILDEMDRIADERGAPSELEFDDETFSFKFED